MKRVVLVGTGTEIGKTHLGVALVSAAVRRGVQACGLKPVESGVPAGAAGEDAAALAAAGPFHVKPAPPYALPDAVSPHLAARRAGVTIELEPIRSWVMACPCELAFIETAGGLLSPLAKGVTNLDLAAALEPAAWILVGVDRLGVLHDVSACCRVLLAEQGARPLVVLQAPSVADGSTGTNAEELRYLGIADPVFTMPRGDPVSKECQVAANGILDALS